MDTKLTLKLKESVIEKAKKYAKTQDTSLSRLVENYLLNITNEKDSKNEITPLVKSLSGIIDLSNDVDLKGSYTAYLAEKYK
jgi:hypothetical protein